MRRYVLAALLIAATALAAGGGAAALLQVTSARLPTQTFTDVVGTATLVPNADKANPASSGRKWTNQAGTECGTTSTSTICSSTIDERLTPTDPLNNNDYIQSKSNPPHSEYVEFELEDAPSDLAQAGRMTVRFWASKDDSGGRRVDVTVEVYRRVEATSSLVMSCSASDLGGPGTLGPTPTRTCTQGIDPLSKTDVDGLFIRIFAATSGGGASRQARVTNVLVDIDYVRSNP